MREAASLALNRLFLWISLAVILTHALTPLGSAAVRGQGSAFSAFTADVSLRAREGTVKRHKAAQAEPRDEPGIGIPGGGDTEADASYLLIQESGRTAPLSELHSQSAVALVRAPHDAFRARAPPAKLH